MNALLVFVGGGVGSLLRYGVMVLVLRWKGTTLFPWATVLANTLAALIMALIIASFARMGDEVPDRVRHFALIGLCGGFSTFSTFSYENFLLLETGQWPWMLANVLVSVVASLAMFWMILYR